MTLVKNFVTRRAWGFALSAIAAALVAALSLIDRSIFGLEWIAHDVMTRRAVKHRPPSADITIAVVNDKSLRTLEPEFGRWQTRSRLLLARAINELANQGARLVVVDIFLASEETSFPEDDRQLAEAMRRIPTILGVQTTKATAGATPAIPPNLQWSSAGREGVRFAVDAPQPLFLSAAAGIGTIRLQQTADSPITRTYPISDPTSATTAIPSLAVEAARQLENLPRRVKSKDDHALVGDRIDIPSTVDGAFRLVWHSRDPRGIGYRAVDFDKIILAGLMREEGGESALPLVEKFAQETTRDKVVFIGATAAGLFDLRSTPLAPAAAGVEIHANALDDLLHRRFLREIPLAISLPLLFFSTVIFGALIYGVRSQPLAASIAMVTAATLLGAEYLLLRRDVILFSVAPLLSILLSWILITVQRMIAEQEQSRQLKATFGRYVSPQILEHILAHPEKVELGGERRELTILFSDIRGFTSISEAAEPEEVVEMLNVYLTRMVDILLAHGGTLDKFIGDAVMGFWNAPAGDDAHALRAVECAIQMIEETARLRAEWEAEGKAAIRIGIGINTGEAVAGNIGSKKVFGYTVIGDAVNLASRLESKNKDYGTEIIISESTLQRIGDRFDAVYLDDVKVKGKEKAVKIYEIKGYLS